ncbi:hypothetical protein NKG94_37250 [Micromonospora sp. M12]
MGALLAKVIERHGGLGRWNAASTLTTRLTYGGPFWAFKGRPDFDGTELVEADLHREQIRHVEEGTGRVTEYDRDTDRVTVTAADGSLIDELTNPGPASPATPGRASGRSPRPPTSVATPPGTTSSSRSCSPGRASRRTRSSRGWRAASRGAGCASRSPRAWTPTTTPSCTTSTTAGCCGGWTTSPWSTASPRPPTT